MTEELVLVVDSSKFDRSAMNRVGPLSAVRVLVVDAGISDLDRQLAEEAGVRVLISSG
jgi:DeoR/GlpR family transcriptional regulator of sugar metabolism